MVISLIEALRQGPPPEGNPAIPILRNAAVEVEVYAPVGTDAQTPHTRDEAYVVARGSADFLCGTERRPVGPGAFLFVPAGREHRFESFSADFAVWVFFFGPEGGKAGG